MAGVPHRNFGREIPLFPLRCSRGIRAVVRQRAHRHPIAPAGHDLAEHLLHKLRRALQPVVVLGFADAHLRRHFHLGQMCQRLVHRLEIHRHDLLALLAIGFANRILDRGNGVRRREHAGDGKETGLHHRVDPPVHSGRARHLIRVDHKKPRASVDDLALSIFRQMLEDTLRSEDGVEQERSALREILQHIAALQQKRRMAGDEICPGNQIR